LGTILLTNAQLRKTLSATRSLGAKGIKTVVAEETRFNPAGFSKYCTWNETYPNPRKHPEAFYNWLIETIDRYHCDSLFPMDDDTLEVVMRHRSELEKVCKLPLPPLESYNIASDKGKTALLLKNAGIDSPETVIPENVDNLQELTAAMKFPLVIKPRKSSGSRGIRIVNDLDELIEEYQKINEVFPNPIIQEYIGVGIKYDVCLLYNSQNQLRASFVQKEIRHFPIDIGPSTVQESVLYPELIEQSLKIMDKLKWYGVVEIEFMVDKRDGKPKVMEINPRFWNSLHMAYLAGIDFPWLLYQIAQQGDVEEGFDYRAGLRCQWTLPGDILHFLSNKLRTKMNPPFLGGKKYEMYDDILSKDDPKPTIGFVLACMRYMLDIEKWKFVFKR
jgi:predicted ATP-grasp superfamily ATP-dependent carboligase